MESFIFSNEDFMKQYTILFFSGQQILNITISKLYEKLNTINILKKDKFDIKEMYNSMINSYNELLQLKEQIIIQSNNFLIQSNFQYTFNQQKKLNQYNLLDDLEIIRKTIENNKSSIENIIKKYFLVIQMLKSNNKIFS